MDPFQRYVTVITDAGEVKVIDFGIARFFALPKESVEEFMIMMEKDDRINFSFGNTDTAKFKQLLFEQLCDITGGPCAYTGRTMKESHEKLAINNTMFNALAEDVYLAFDRAGVPYRLQNKVMAIFAPMQRDIVK
jgi:hemoglobin